MFSVSRESNREVDAEIDAFLGSKSPKKPVDPLSYIKVREKIGLCVKITFPRDVLVTVSYFHLLNGVIFEEIPN